MYFHQSSTLPDTAVHINMHNKWLLGKCSVNNRKAIYNLDLNTIKINDPIPNKPRQEKKKKNCFFLFLSHQASLQVIYIDDLSVVQK